VSHDPAQPLSTRFVIGRADSNHKGFHRRHGEPEPSGGLRVRFARGQETVGGRPVPG
jgi:hypothetical protein